MLWSIIIVSSFVVGLVGSRTLVAIAMGLLLPYVRIEPAPYDVSFALFLLTWLSKGRLRHLYKTNNSYFLTRSDWLLVAFLICNIVSLVIAGGDLRYFLITLYGAAAYAICRSLDFGDAINLAYGYTASAYLQLITSLVMRLSGGDLFDRVMYGLSRMKGTFKDPNVFGAFYVPLFVGCLAMVVADGPSRPQGPKRWRSRHAWTGLVAATFGIITSHSRGAAVAAAVGALLVALLHGGWTKKDSLLRWASALAVAVTFGMALQVGVYLIQGLRSGNDWLATLRGSFSDLEGRTGLQSYDAYRFNAHLLGIQAALAHPLGVGPGRFLEVIGYDAHSLYVRALTENGWLGLISLLGWLLATAGGLWRRREASEGPISPATLLAILGGLAVQSLVIDTIHWRHLWLLCGLAVTSGEASPRPSQVAADVKAVPETRGGDVA